MTKIFALGESALTVELSDEISPRANDLVLALAYYFETNNFQGFIETVPAYSSLTIFYDAAIVRKNYNEFRSAFDAVKHLAENGLRDFTEIKKSEARIVEIPVCFDDEAALDLQFVAETAGISARRVIEIFTGRVYRVYMLGFLPGFAYMGEIDSRIAVPRKDAPRLNVPRGSVAVAGRQAGIYPLDSPGGWQIIGRTNLDLFDPNAEYPTFLRAGDRVKFYQSPDRS